MVYWGRIGFRSGGPGNESAWLTWVSVTPVVSGAPVAGLGRSGREEIGLAILSFYFKIIY